ncbi:MAG TPA: ScpA family protein [Acidimicrobiia bacterium]|nr:ScpA family protein [Acidimicrobiia bacterium]
MPDRTRATAGHGSGVPPRGRAGNFEVAMGYEVTTAVYEGPFDLLLHLILRQEVDLFEVSLATIVDEYLTELDRMESLDLEIATEFLLIAATLVELKARRLLPTPQDLELDEELLRFEERDLLLARLLDAKTFKDAAQAMAALMREADRSVARTAGPEEPFRSLVPDPLERLKPERLRDAARRALAPRPSTHVDTEHVAPIRASVADAIDLVLELLPEGASATFRDLTRYAATRLDVIVRFLAVLELYKQGVVDLDQTETFGVLTVARHVGGATLDAASIADWDTPAAAPEPST